MRNICAIILALCACLTGQHKVVIQNLATMPQREWCFIALPREGSPTEQGFAVPGDSTAPGYRYVPTEGGVWVLADVPANTRVIAQLQQVKQEDAFWTPFELHRSIVDIGIQNLLPSFWARSSDGASIWKSRPPIFWPSGSPRPAGAFVRVIESDDAHQTWHMRTRIEEAVLTIDWWARIGSGTPDIEWTVHMVYGDTRPGQPISVQMGAVGMTVGAEPVVDFAKRVNIPVAGRSTEGWMQTLMQPAPWGRASRIEVRGALLTVADSPRRQGRPVFGVYGSWNGSWMAMGRTPEPYPGAEQLSASRLANYLNPPAGNMYDQRPGCQPKISGTTGEQDEFGVAVAEEAVTMLNPWAIHQMFWQVQSYAMRPTANKEPNGDPVQAKDHPRTVTTNQRPDHRFSAADMIGWPNPIPYSWAGSGYSTSDDQHRCGGMLCALYTLTRDPALRSIILDLIEMQKLALPRSGDRAGTPRAIGRVLQDNCDQLWLGFEDARPFVMGTIDWCYEKATMRRIPNDPQHPVRILAGYEEAKYGWRTPDNKPIIGWQPWQETIAAAAFMKAYLVTGSPRARELAIDLARTCTDQAFYHYGSDTSRWWHTYAQRWRAEDEGAAHPVGAWFPTQPNYDINTDGACMRWTLMAPRIFLFFSGPEDPLYPKAKELAASRPASWFDSRWWAIPR